MADQEEDNVHRSFHTEAGSVIFDKPRSAEEAARQTRENEQHKFARQQVITNRLLAWFTAALVLATACTIGVGIWQGSISQRSANAARDAVKVASDTLTETQASNARQAALAEKARESSDKNSSQTLQATIDQFHQDQRAWLGVCDLALLQLEDDKPIVAQIKLCNTGKTPASHVQERGKYRTEYEPKYIPTDAEVNQFSPTNAQSVPPQGFNYLKMGDFSKSYTAVATANERAGMDALSKSYADIKAGRMTIFYYGDIRYFDTFGKPHTTKFCIFLSDPATKEMLYCPEYNEMN